jgi:hypothetical protein
MNNYDYVTKNEIAVNTLEAAKSLMAILMENNYVVMISREEKLYIVNYVWSSSGYADRNDVVFNSREIIEEMIYNTESEEE